MPARFSEPVRSSSRGSTPGGRGRSPQRRGQASYANASAGPGSAGRPAAPRRPAPAQRATPSVSAALGQRGSSIPAPQPLRPVAATFTELGVPTLLVESLARGGITAPFPIQSATLPDSLAGRDLLGRGRTGSGKTVAFALPMVATLAASGRKRLPGRPRALVLAPTRELANQIAEVVAPLAATAKMQVLTVFGGVSQAPQVRQLRDGVDIVIACPGRLEDLKRQGHVDLSAVEITVLDEADHMADLGFLPGVTRLLEATKPGTQRLLFSATLDNDIEVLVRRFLVDPVVHAVDPIEEPITTMTHHVFTTEAAEKGAVVRDLASGVGRSLLFTRTKHAAKKLAKQLTDAGIPATDLHGNLAQNARERNLAAFAEGRVKVLVATDIAARGIHVDDIEIVVHVDPPAEHKAYLHRSGRTARAGADGVVVTVITPDQSAEVKVLAKRAGITPHTARVSPGDSRVRALVGPAAPHVPASERPVISAPAPSSPGRSRRGGPSVVGARRTSSPVAARPASVQPRTSSAAAFSERGARRGTARRAG